MNIFLALILFCWFFYITFVNLVEITILNGFIVKAIPSLLVLITFLFALLFTSSENANPAYPKATILKLSDPVTLFCAYLCWAGLSLLQTVSNPRLFYPGFGYLFAYIIVLINAGFLYSLLVNNKIILTNEGDIKDDSINPVCTAAFWAATILLVFMGYKAYRTGILFTGERLLMLDEMMPASIGIIAMLVVIYFVAFRKTIITWTILLIALILLVKGESRTALISVFLASTATYLLKLRKISRIIIVSSIGAITVGAIILIFPSIINLIQDKALLLNDAHKGTYGLSGRYEVWMQALKVFAKNPIMGIGFKISAPFLNAHNLTSAHNGYLASLLETGIVGTILLLATVIMTQIRLIKLAWITGDSTSAFYFGIIFGTLLFAIGESYIMNIGNVTTLMCFFALFHSRIKVKNK